MYLASLSMPAGSEWLAVVLAYLLGSVPFGYLFGRMRGVDLRKVGSGNIGATNTGRAIGKPLGYLAFLLDFGKGLVPATWFAVWFGSGAPEVPPGSLAVWCGMAAVCGHVWPIYLRFPGGKAVATGAGVIVAFEPLIFVLGGAVWLITLFSLGFVSLASIAMAVSFPVIAWQVQSESGFGSEVIAFCLAFALLVVYRHKSNLARLAKGLEPHWRDKLKKKS